MIGKSFAHYEIINQIGEGGMGEVFLANDTTLDRKVAIKFLPESLGLDETAHKRFMREARSAAALDHPYICSIHEVGQAEGRSFIVMEYVEGQTLNDRMVKGEVPLRDAMQWAVEVAEALAVAHEKGIIHRDLKPSNIMISRTGHAKVMDFGLAKQLYPLSEAGTQEETLTGLTREGTTLGTIPYMSPEQIQGKAVDLRSDLFSFGIVIYEMLSGVNPFKRETSFNTADAIRRETPPPLSKYRENVPQQLEDLINKLLAKEAEGRIRQARDAEEVLKKVLSEIFGEQIVSSQIFASVRNILRKPAFLIALIIILAGIAYFSMKGVTTYQRGKWAREVAPNEVERLMEQDRPVAASWMLRESLKYAPESRELNQLQALLLAGSISIETTPPDAEIYIRDYIETGDNGPSNWELLGRSPFTSQAFPSGYHQFRFVKDGFEPVEIAGPRAFSIQQRLHPRGAIPEGMVWVRAIRRGEELPPVAPESAAEFWIDKYEVTNRQFKNFVDAGGYQNREYWKQAFLKDGQQLDWEEAMVLFRDSTGRPGPATWEFGNYPEGEADFPVGGVSWYEAAAFAEFVGKSLPTVYHWKCAGGVNVYADIPQYSNFSAESPAQVGTYRGLGDFGTYDMAGNMKEWCWNEIEGRRYILGGAWNEPAYTFNDPDARQPFDRADTFGFRCVKYIEQLPKALAQPVVAFFGLSLDRSGDKPADNQTYQIYLNLHDYDKTELNPSIESVDETSSQFWKKERATFQAAYGNERMIADLYLPKNAKLPYQAVIYWPGADAFFTKTLSGVNLRFITFVNSSGRAMIVPHYKGTLERGAIQIMPGRMAADQPNLYREMALQWSKDLGRTIDYLETRDDIDTEKISYIGVSWGAYVGPRLVAVEPRIKAAVFAAGGDIPAPGVREEVDAWNFAPRVKVPVLMLNGKSDFTFPLETSQLPLLNLLGTPEKDKKHLLYKGAHEIFDQIKVFRDMLDWLDSYIGPASM